MEIHLIKETIYNKIYELPHLQYYHINQYALYTLKFIVSLQM